MSPTAIKARVGGISLQVPICVDHNTTLRLVKRVNDYLERLEKETGRIDTQTYALKAALAFAAEAEELRRERDHETAALANALDEVVETFRKLSSKYRFGEE